MNKYLGDDLGGKIPKLVNISLEAVIAEIVDNSLDAKAKKVHVEITGTNWNNFSVVVYDNSEDGFGSEEELDTAFRLAGKKDREDGAIGSFHMGMQISTLSKFRRVAAFTTVGEEIVHRRVCQTHIDEEKYEPLSDPIYPRKDEVTEKMKADNWTTAVCLSVPKSILFGSSQEIKSKSLKGFSKQLSMFFGITYQDTLEGNENLTITINEESVVGLDPFWKDFTPSKITEKLAIPTGGVEHVTDAIQRNTLLCTIPWGTIATNPVTLHAEYNGESHALKVQGFIIPYGKVRTELVEADLAGDVFIEKPSDAGTTTLNAQFLQGFFFYREGRCIAFGDTGLNSNEGWYDYGSSGNNLMLSVRFKVDFPRSLDGFMNLSPTKSTVEPVSEFYQLIQSAWDQKINEPLLRRNLGDNQRAFYSKTETGKTVVGAASTTNMQKKLFEDGCVHCEGFHAKGTECHNAPCSICDSATCNPSCKYKCDHCKSIGDHLSRDCPMNCNECGEEGGHKGAESCPEICTTCDKNHSECACPCESCGKPKDSECECQTDCEVCDMPDEDCICNQDESELNPYPDDKLMELTLYRKNKDKNIEILREALTYLKIDKDEL